MDLILSKKPGIGRLFADLTIALCILWSFSIFKGHADLVLAFAWLFILAYILLTRRFVAVTHLLLATIVALTWVDYARDYYGYKIVYYTIFGMNLLPLMAWALSLFGLSEVYNYLNLTKKRYKFLLFIPIFWAFLITFETIAYHILELRNTTTGSFVGLPFCDCIHAPTWMKVVYFSMGPVYYSGTMLVDHIMDKVSSEFSGLKTRGENNPENSLLTREGAESFGLGGHL